MAAPVASGWSVCRVGLAPTGKRRIITAHTQRGRHQRARPRALSRRHPGVCAWRLNAVSHLERIELSAIEVAFRSIQAENPFYENKSQFLFDPISVSGFNIYLA
jgi:hypothetical protein